MNGLLLSDDRVRLAPPPAGFAALPSEGLPR